MGPSYKMQAESDSMKDPRRLRGRLLQQVFGRPLKDFIWILISGLWVTALILGYIGFSKSAVSKGESSTPLDLIYLTLQLITLESGSGAGPLPWELEVARFALPTLAAYTVIQALALLFREQRQRLRLWFIRDHIVICGLSRKGLLLARSLLECGEDVVVIELDEGNDLIKQLQVRGAIVLIGDGTDRAVLNRAAVHRARCLLAVCDDDGTNAEIAVQAQNLVKDLSRDPLTCIIHIVDPQLCDLLRENEIGGETFTQLRLELFNVFERAAQLLLREFSPFSPERGQPDLAPHILLIGMGRMGENILTQAAYTWHIRNPDSNNPLRITMIDLKASEKWKSLEVRVPHLTDCCQVQTLSMDVRSPDFYQANFLSDSQGNAVDIIYVCFDNDSLGLNVGLTLLSRTKKQDIPIIVRMMEGHGLASLLGEASEEGSAFRNLHAYGLLDKTCKPELLFGGVHEMLARAVHEDYVQEQKLLGYTSEDNPTLVPWDQLSEEKKGSNRRYADHMGIKLGAVEHRIEPLRDWNAVDYEFKENDIEIMARMEHERWCQELRREGWRYGPTRDDARKVHPALVPWTDLPENERDKNRDFIRDLPRLLSRVGFQVQRSN
ncbi:MAG: hypothetical protein AMJ88_09400 [Anaerolineae bacterium SM23_ 63]|nr:MAG: hypothetical protein AMJ88_09400 [Anaerolineae bacterium SM23_ 63]HEY45963.1 hypothetical protein [Anaerolineae bacterium]